MIVFIAPSFFAFSAIRCKSFFSCPTSRNIEIPYGGKYSVDENLWGRSVEGSSMEFVDEGVPEDAYRWVLPVERSG